MQIFYRIYAFHYQFEFSVPHWALAWTLHCRRHWEFTTERGSINIWPLSNLSIVDCIMPHWNYYLNNGNIQPKTSKLIIIRKGIENWKSGMQIENGILWKCKELLAILICEMMNDDHSAVFGHSKLQTNNYFVPRDNWIIKMHMYIQYPAESFNLSIK